MANSTRRESVAEALSDGRMAGWHVVDLCLPLPCSPCPARSRAGATGAWVVSMPAVSWSPTEVGRVGRCRIQRRGCAPRLEGGCGGSRPPRRGPPVHDPRRAGALPPQRGPCAGSRIAPVLAPLPRPSPAAPPRPSLSSRPLPRPPLARHVQLAADVHLLVLHCRLDRAEVRCTSCPRARHRHRHASWHASADHNGGDTDRPRSLCSARTSSDRHSRADADRHQLIEHPGHQPGQSHRVPKTQSLVPDRRALSRTTRLST